MRLRKLTHLPASRNNFPHPRFNWVRLNGTQLRCDLTPMDTADEQTPEAGSPAQNLESLVFGNGDGTGPPLTMALTLMKNPTPAAPPIRVGTKMYRELPPVHMCHSDKLLRLPRGEFAGREGAADLEGSPMFFPALRCMVYNDAEKLYAEVREVFMLERMQLTISHKRITSLSARRTTGGIIILEDRPNYWDACNVEIHDLEKTTHLKSAKVLVVAQDPRCASVYKHSRISITISLDAVPASTTLDSRSMLGFNAWVDWC
ncbi:hypothetical protein B0H14DRAFT_3751072 [Mycena olivaceomarginata]|nr:hypothetical protein B0H14DRAFT_3751072 [Mycena olivaceomarginata]